MRLICEVNDRMAESFERLPFEGPTAFICECGRPGCTGRVLLTLREYRTIRGHPGRFAIAPGHAPTSEGVDCTEPVVVAETRA